MKKILEFFRKNIFVISLLIYSFFCKFILIWPNIFPFTFDHGKDSLAILHMIKTLSPKFIGPWTSIPGLFFGPGWYYLLAPGFFISNGNPISAIITMIILNLITIYLAYKYFGKIEAILFATTQAFTMLSTSAWNPFPVPLLTLIILINLKPKSLKLTNLILIFGVTSLCFHFSSAFAVFLLISLLIILFVKFFKNNQRLKFSFFIYSVLAFSIPFIPQGIFELRHNFIETKAVLSYFSNPPENQVSYNLNQVLVDSIKEISLAIFPNLSFPKINSIIFIVSILFLLASIYFTYQKKQLRKLKYIFEFLILFTIPILGFSKIHFNIWYIYGLFPIAIVFVSQFYKNLPKFILYLFIGLFLISPILKIVYSFKIERLELKNSQVFLPIKIKAVSRIRELSNNKPFSSYHYAGAIYDYGYQYLYLWQAFSGQKLPVEFSYEPETIDYIPEKKDLLSKLPQTDLQPEYIFYIVEKSDKDTFLNQWWNKQNYKEIIYQEKLSNDLTLYQALPN